jgi:hypothetical protein
MKLIRWVLAIAMGAAAGCGSDDGGETIDAGASPDATVTDGGGDPTCPTPTFTSIHEKVFRDFARCGVCHGNDNMANNLGDLTIPQDKALAYAAVTANSRALGAPKPKRIAPGMPDESWLFIKLLPDPPVGTRMPQTGPLKACEIEAIRTWITSGAMND